jgi:hypothetical protein
MPRVSRSYPVPRPLILALALVLAPHGAKAEITLVTNPDGTQTVVVTGAETGGVIGNAQDGKTNTLLFSPPSGYTVNVSPGAVVSENVTGGITNIACNRYQGDVCLNITNNTVNVHGSVESAAGAVAGTDADNQALIGNTVNIYDGGTVNTDVRGSTSVSSHTARENHVNIFGGTVNGNVYGAHFLNMSGNTTVTDNQVSITGGTVNGNVYGGYAASVYTSTNDRWATATGNQINIAGGTVNGNVYGGYARNYSNGTDPRTNAVATDNTITLSNQPTFGPTSELHGGFAAHNDADAFTGNRLKVENYSGGSVYGIYDFENYEFVLPDDLTAGQVVLRAGTLNLTNGIGTSVGATSSRIESIQVGGRQDRLDLGDSVKLIEATTLLVSNSFSPFFFSSTDGSVTASWRAAVPDVIDTHTLSLFLQKLETDGDFSRSNGFAVRSGANADESVLLRVDGTLSVSGGGLVMDDSQGKGVTVKAGTLDATRSDVVLRATRAGNGDGTSGVFFDTLTLGGGRTLTLDAPVDGFGYAAATHNVVHEATLKGDLNAAHGAMNFYVPPTAGNGAILLTLSGVAYIDGSWVEVGIDGHSSPLKMNDTLVLIDSASGLDGKPGNDKSTGMGLFGNFLRYEFCLSTTPSRLHATVCDIRTTPQAEALPNAHLSGAILGSQSLDLAADPGLAAAQDTLRRGRNIFVFFEGGSSRYTTGSHIDVDSKLLMTGIAGETSVASGLLTLSTFLAHGQGRYDTYDDFHDDAGVPGSIEGEGEIEYTGLGVLGRLDFAGTDGGYPYVEASLQGGRVRNTFHSSDLKDPRGRRTKYDSATYFHGAHLGAGYVFKSAGEGEGELDLYGKLLHARRGGDRVTLSTGETVHFADIESRRLRIGARYTWTMGTPKPYIGLAWEREFDGKARATVHDRIKIDTPELKGDTRIAELGMTFSPGRAKAMTVDLAVRAYFGRRDGVSGSMRAEFRF